MIWSIASRATDTLTPANWITAVEVLLGTGDIVTATHLGGAGKPSRFYRVRLLTSSEATPAANFTASPKFGQSPLKVTFTDNSTGYITNRSWDFGDGATTNTSAGAVSHIYAAGGSNTVTLTVSGPLGVSTRTQTNYIAVTDQLLITSMQSSGSNVVISFTSRAGRFYSVEYADALSLSPWSIAVGPVAGTGDIVSATHIGGASRSFRFYRVKQLP